MDYIAITNCLGRHNSGRITISVDEVKKQWRLFSSLCIQVCWTNNPNGYIHTFACLNADYNQL